MFKSIGNRRYFAIDDNLMDENILEEICRLMRIQTDINAFNEAKKKSAAAQRFSGIHDQWFSSQALTLVLANIWMSSSA